MLKVSGSSVPNKVAGAVAGAIRETGEVELVAIGAGAVNQAVKAIAIARGFVAPQGIDLICVPSFLELTMETGTERTAIRFYISPRRKEATHGAEVSTAE